MRIDSFPLKRLQVFYVSTFVSLIVLAVGCHDQGTKVIDSSRADVPVQTAAELQAEADAEITNSGLID